MSHYDPFDTQAQDTAREEQSERDKFLAKVEEEDLKWLMSSKRGRRIVCRQLERAGVWRLSFNTNAMTMAFNEGQRNEGLVLLAKITTYCPDRYAEMLEERSKNG